MQGAAKARRRMAKFDERYASKGRVSADARTRQQQRQIERQKAIAQRKGQKKG